MAVVADSEFFNDNVSFYHLRTKNKKRLTYDVERRLKYIPGVLNAEVELDIPEQSMIQKDCKSPSAKIHLTVQKDYDKKKIEKSVKNMITGRIRFIREPARITSIREGTGLEL